MKADEGFKLEVMQVVPLQVENRQAVERSQSVAVDLRDVVVTQLQHLHTQTGYRRTQPASHAHVDRSSTHLQSRQHVQAPVLQHRQSVVVQVELSESGQTPEHAGADEHKLVITQVQLLYVVKILQAGRSRVRHTYSQT